jgi:hypothetical protein
MTAADEPNKVNKTKDVTANHASAIKHKLPINKVRSPIISIDIDPAPLKLAENTKS